MTNFAASEDHFEFRKCKGRQMLQIPINFREVWGLGGDRAIKKETEFGNRTHFDMVPTHPIFNFLHLTFFTV